MKRILTKHSAWAAIAVATAVAGLYTLPALADCTQEAAAQGALELQKARDGARLRYGQCLIVRLNQEGRSDYKTWNGNTGYAFDPILSTDNGYDYREFPDWNWEIFVPLSTCQPVWLRSRTARPIAGPVTTGATGAYFCAPEPTPVPRER